MGDARFSLLRILADGRFHSGERLGRSLGVSRAGVLDLVRRLEDLGLRVFKVRGRGFLLGVELVDPRDGTSFLPEDLDAGALVDDVALEHDLLVTSTHPQADGFAGDQTLLAPAYVASEEELTQMVERFGETIADVERRVKDALAGAGSAG